MKHPHADVSKHELLDKKTIFPMTVPMTEIIESSCRRSLNEPIKKEEEKFLTSLLHDHYTNCSIVNNLYQYKKPEIYIGRLSSRNYFSVWSSNPYRLQYKTRMERMCVLISYINFFVSCIIEERFNLELLSKLVNTTKQCFCVCGASTPKEKLTLNNLCHGLVLDKISIIFEKRKDLISFKLELIEEFKPVLYPELIEKLRKLETI